MDLYANHFLIKLILAPIIISGATLAARKWGENIGGVIVGLPLTSGPISAFFAAEQGRGFAAFAAKESILGLIPVAVFCTAYSFSARRLSWQAAAGMSIGLYLAAVWGISKVSLTLGWVGLLVPLVLAVALWLTSRPSIASRSVAVVWWDLPVRIVIATSLLIAITTLAGALGPTWSGLLSPFPVFTFVMAIFSHSQGGPGAALRLVRGVLLGLFSYTTFFLVVGSLVGQASPLAVYPLATAAALAVNGLALVIMLKKQSTNPG